MPSALCPANDHRTPSREDHKVRRLVIALAAGVLLIGSQSLTFTATADNADKLEELCQKQLKLGDSGCACVNERAEAELNDTQQALIVARVSNDRAAFGELLGQLSNEEADEATKFMTETPEICSAE
jgi:hypothetical protein